MVTLETKIDAVLYDGGWERMYQAAGRYLAQAEQAFATGDVGGALVMLGHAKHILGMKVEPDE
ncbi:MAG: hypothetical protein L3J68_00240 [Thermoplasmata archaeon]|nr:hypothetical protein [Thermoplasmata archaeon]